MGLGGDHTSTAAQRKARRSRGPVAPPVGVGSFPDLASEAQARVEGSPVKAPSLIWLSLRPHRRPIIWFFVVVTFQITGVLGFAATMKNMVDEGIVDRSKPLSDFTAQATAFSVVVLVTATITGYLVRQLAFEVEFDLRTWLYTRIHASDLEAIGGMTSGQLVTRSIADLNFVGLVIGLLPILVAIVPAVIAVGIYLTILNVVMGLTSISSLVVNLYLSRRLGPRLRALSFAELNERAEVTVAIDEPVRGIRVVHAFGSEEREAANVRATALRVYRWAMARTRLLARFDVLLKSVPMFVYAVVLYVGARLVADGSLSLGAFTLAFGLVGAVTLFAISFDQLVSVWQFFLSAQRRLTEVLEMGVAPASAASGPAPEVGDLRLVDVSVDLGGRRILDGLTLEVLPGALTLLEGAPGSGKSTVAAVAAGLVPASEGRVEIGGLPVASFGSSVAGSVVRVVSEESFLFAGTVLGNLELGARGDASPEQIQAALRAASAEDVVAELSGGLQSTIGDRGLTLSGGQRQRLALARALVSPPKVLVLDDALSAVQPALEVEILQRIRAHAPDMAILCISRRHGAATIADTVLTLPPPSGDPTARVPTKAPALTIDPLIAAALTPEVLSTLQKLQAAMATSQENPVVSDELCESDLVPTVRNALVRPFLSLMAIALGVLLLQTAGQVTPQILLGRLSDLARDGKLGAVNVRVGFLVLVAIASAGTAYVFTILSQKFNQGVMYQLRRRLFGRLSRLGNDFYDRELPGQIAARVVNDLDNLGLFLQTAGFLIVVGLVQMLVTLGILVYLAPNATVAVLGVLALVAACTGIQAIYGSRANDRARDALGIVTSAFEEDLTGTHELRNLGAVDRQTGHFVQAAWNLRNERRRVGVLAAIFGSVLPFLGNLLAIVVLERAGQRAFAGAISVGTTLSVRLLADAATNPLGALSTQFSQLLEVRVSWTRLHQPFAVPITPLDRPTATQCPELTGRLAFDGVGFTYPGTGRAILHDLSFETPAGGVVAIVGYTGAGKSSISKLITRVYDPDAGQVNVDGLDIRSWTGGSFRTRVGVVPQDAFVFKGSVASNIAYGRPSATRDEVTAAASAVGAHEVFTGLPQGYDHPVEEAGVNLTVAQRQLVALARAWLTRPDLLVLDEATSALDAGLEAGVLQAVKSLGVTTIMVTHRESVVAAADEVIVLDAGRIVQTGTPATVMAEGGAFAALWHGPSTPPAAVRTRRRKGAVAPEVSPAPG